MRACWLEVVCEDKAADHIQVSVRGQCGAQAVIRINLRFKDTKDDTALDFTALDPVLEGTQLPQAAQKG